MFAPSPDPGCRRPPAGCGEQAHRAGMGVVGTRPGAPPYPGGTPPPSPRNGALPQGPPRPLTLPARALRGHVTRGTASRCFLDTRWRQRRPLERKGGAGGEAGRSSLRSLRFPPRTLYPPSPSPLYGLAAARRWQAGGSGRWAAGGAVTAGAAAIMLGEPGLGRGAGWRERAVPERRGAGGRCPAGCSARRGG